MIPAELIKEGGRTICYQIYKLTVSIWNKEELPEEWKELIIVPIHKKGNKTDCNNYSGLSTLPNPLKILSTSFFQERFHMQRKLLGIINVGSDETGRLIIIYSTFVKCLRRMEIQ
jgi:hypothetical protein